MNHQVLVVNSSGRFEGSITRQITRKLLEQLKHSHPELEIINRDLATGVPFIDEQWIDANFTPSEKRKQHHHNKLSLSDALVDELQQASHLIIASPIYNFSIPAVLKAWIDLIARARLTFEYTNDGPVGLLKNKKAYLIMASGGVPIGSEMDFASSYLKQVLLFLGVSDVTWIDANNLDVSKSLNLVLS